MRFTHLFTLLVSVLIGSGCVHKGTNANDPYEPINRKIHQFNMAFDATLLKPPARLYTTITPVWVQAGISNFYNNVMMLPAMANDVLQADWHYVIKDYWRFVINSTLGLAGFMDVAASHCSLPVHHNDLGLTFAKWGNKKSPYIVIPFLGPSTIRDGMGMLFDYALFIPYAYISNSAILYPLLGLDYIQLRAQLFDIEPLMAEALDQYAFLRDSYLQHRNAIILGDQSNKGFSAAIDQMSSQYVDDEETH